MTITTISLPHRAPRGRMVPWARPASWAGAGRLVRLEIRHSAVIWMLPLLAVLAWFDAYRAAASLAPVWDLRESVLTNQLLQDWEALVAGAGAWAGSREGRRHTTELVTQTVRSAWARRIIALAATVGWVLAAYLAFTGVLFGITAGQATWGGPNWWPVAAGAAALICVCATGFVIGVFIPARLTVPVTATGMFVLSAVGAYEAGFRLGLHRQVGPLSSLPVTSFDALRASGAALLSPSTGTPSIDTGVFYPYLPDLAIAQLILLAGITATAAGVLGLRQAAVARAALRRAAAVTVAGMAAVGTAFGLGNTAYQTARGAVVPALHDAASDRSVSYTPVCERAAGVPVCAHPAFRRILPDLTAALGPLFAEVARLPGAPARVAADPSVGLIGEIGWYGGVHGEPPSVLISGAPPVLYLRGEPPPDAYGADTAVFNVGVQSMFVVLFTIPPGSTSAGNGGTQAQEAVQAALLQDGGSPFLPGCEDGPMCQPGTPVYETFHRFAALPATARHAWLAGHLDALRAGHITLPEIP